MARERVVAQWQGDRQVTELLLVDRDQNVTHIADLEQRSDLNIVAATFPDLPIDIRHGAFRQIGASS